MLCPSYVIKLPLKGTPTFSSNALPNVGKPTDTHGIITRSVQTINRTSAKLNTVVVIPLPNRALK